MKNILRKFFGLAIITMLLSACDLLKIKTYDDFISERTQSSSEEIDYGPFKICWYDCYNQLLGTSYTEYGEIPYYPYGTPTVVGDYNNEFTFLYWEPNPTPAYEDANYIGVFEHDDGVTFYFNPTGGTCPTSSMHFEKDQIIDNLPTPYNTNGHFAGWGYDGQSIYNGMTNTFAGKITLSASWAIDGQYEINVSRATNIYNPSDTSGYSSITEIGELYSGTTEKTVSCVPADGYVFVGWYSLQSGMFVSTNPTYTFTCTNQNIDLLGVVLGNSYYDIEFNINGQPRYSVFEPETVLFGYYPQTHINDPTIVSYLESSATIADNGYYQYAGRYFTFLETPSTVSSNTYLTSGAMIEASTKYWFLVEPIRWKFYEGNGFLRLLSKYLLDTQVYYSDLNTREIGGKTIYPSNYKESNLRYCLNNVFYSLAFDANQRNMIMGGNTDNSIATGLESASDMYFCENTFDYVIPLSYADYNDPSFGMYRGRSAMCFNTDYAKVKSLSNYKQVGLNEYSNYYYTRTPANANSVYTVRPNGNISSSSVTYANDGLRPMLYIH